MITKTEMDEGQLFNIEPSSQWGGQSKITPRDFKDHVYVGKNARDTSVEAAKRILPKTGTQRRRVFDYIVSKGEYGATDAELMTELGLSGNSLHPRRLELCQAGLIEDSTKRRKTPSGADAIVWVRIKETQ